MALFPTLVYRFQCNPYQNSADFFVEINKLILNFIRNSRKIIFQNNNEVTVVLSFKTYCKLNNQENKPVSVVLAWRKRSMEHNWVWKKTYLGYQDNSMGKGQSCQQMMQRQLNNHKQKNEVGPLPHTISNKSNI